LENWCLFVKEYSVIQLRYRLLNSNTQTSNNSLLEKVQVLDQLMDAGIVEAMSEAEFRLEVLPRLYLALDADVSPEIEMNIDDFEATLWRHTQGNWHRIEAVTTIFDEELGPRNGDVRVINPEIEERVNQRLNRTKRQ
jgi:hypothetical protein